MQTKHERAYAVAGANTVGNGATRQYVGRVALDGATLDRFVQIEIKYDEALEHRLAHQNYAEHGGTDISQVNEWVRTVQATRAKLATMGSIAIVSPRASIAGAKLLARGMSFEKIIPMILTKHLSADEKQQLNLGTK